MKPALQSDQATPDGSVGHSRNARWRRRAVLAEIAVIIVLLASTVAVLGWHADEQDFSVDESRWIATSRYYWITFVERDVLGSAWQPNYLVLTHPPVARYLIGFGLSLQGWTPDRLNGRYDTDRSREFNREVGNIPGSDLLDAARRVVLVFGTCATMLLYPIGRLVGGPVAGAAAVVLALANPLLATLWTRALAESILGFFSLLSFLLALIVARADDRRRLYPVVLGLGVALALAAATKLTGVFVGLGVAAFVVVERAAKWRAGGRWPGTGLWLDALLAAVVVFVLVNPLLYPHPVMRTMMLFEHRRDEMRQQAIGTPRLAVPPDIGSRAALLYRRTFDEYGTVNSRAGLPLSPDAALAASGLCLVALASWRSLRQSGLATPTMLVLTWALATYVLSTVNLGFNSSHYFALPVLLAVLLEAVALAAVVRATMGIGRRQQRPVAVAARA